VAISANLRISQTSAAHAKSYDDGDMINKQATPPLSSSGMAMPHGTPGKNRSSTAAKCTDPRPAVFDHAQDHRHSVGERNPRWRQIALPAMS
jgi:hypothetical protein